MKILLIGGHGTIGTTVAAYFPGPNPVPKFRVVNAYVRSVMGRGNGENIRVYE